MVDQTIMDRRIADSGGEDLPTRVQNVLRNEGIETIGDLCRMTEREIMRCPNFARASLTAVKEWLIARGLRLGMDFSTHIKVERRWIATSNAEWGTIVPGKGWVRGGSIAGALAKAAEGIDGAVGGTVSVLPDTTAEQARRAHRAFFGEG